MITGFISAHALGHPLYVTDPEDSVGVVRDWRYADNDEPLCNAKLRKCVKC
mgnify:CR=1 FL=1